MQRHQTLAAIADLVAATLETIGEGCAEPQPERRQAIEPRRRNRAAATGQPVGRKPQVALLARKLGLRRMARERGGEVAKARAPASDQVAHVLAQIGGGRVQRLAAAAQNVVGRRQDAGERAQIVAALVDKPRLRMCETAKEREAADGDGPPR